MIKIDGKYYLTYSANYYQNSTYSVGLAISDNPLSGFQKVDYNPILEANPDWTHISGTGHNCIFQSPDGTELWMAYHSHIDTTNGGSERKINFDRIAFDEEGRMLVNGPSITPQVLPSGVSEYKNIATEATMSARADEYKDLRDILGLDRFSQVLMFSTEGNTDPMKFRKVLWDGEFPTY